MPQVNRTYLHTLSTFSGLGGLDLGLECAGFSIHGHLEIDEAARQSLKLNRPKWTAIEPAEVNTAAEQLKPADLGLRRRQLSLLAGAPPCQPFSKAAQWSKKSMRGLNDSRSDCIQGFLQLADKFLPRVILMENVQGFASGRANAVGMIEKALLKINARNRSRYQLQWWIVDAADYGVPQHRQRAILFAERNGAQISLPPSSHSRTRVTAWDALAEVQSQEDQTMKAKHWLELLPTIPEGQNYLWHTPRGGGEPLFGYRSRYWSFLLKLAKNRPSWTLPAQPGPYAGPFHWDSRRLTIEEMLRLQSFPTNWRVEGSDREKIRQIGNATPPLLAEVIGRAISKQIFGIDQRRAPKLQIQKTSRPCPEPEPVKTVPRKFRSRRKAWPDHPGTGLGPNPILVEQ